MSQPSIAIASYTEDQWLLLKQRCADPEVMDPTYAAWLKGRDKAIASLKEQGYATVLVNLDVAEIEAWCNARMVKNTGASRSELCAQKFQQICDRTAR